MGRYSKSYSNYVLKKHHQDVNDGTIIERDWGTLGERHVIESGKRKFYADSTFLFTDNTTIGNKFRNNTGPWSDPYTQDSLGDKVDSTVNDTSILDDSCDIRDYAYYGSAVELVRASIENIIKWFPGRFWASNSYISRLNETEDGWFYIKQIVTDGHHNYAIEYTTDQSECEIFVINNPFTINFYDSNVVSGKYDNPLRNMTSSFKRYEINGGDILTWDVWIKPNSDCDENYTIKYEINFTYIDGGIIKTGCLYGIIVNKKLIWCTDVVDLMAQPKSDVIDNYFSGLSGFEAKLLNRSNNPLYSTKLLTPVPFDSINPNYYYVERVYTWPHEGYCIAVDTIGFENYLSSLYGLASLMDELWCDNIWKNMTHEAITNFDWTYTKNYEEGQEEENILGGTRIEGILRIWGRCFDDIKRYINGISLKNCVTYDNDIKNLGNAELSDKAELLGWEIYSTKLNNDDNLYLDEEFVATYLERWYDTKNPESVSQNSVDNDFMKRLVLNSSEIFRTKGTKHAIEMAFAMFGIGCDNTPRTYYYTSNVMPQEPLGMDDFGMCSSYNKIDGDKYEFYLSNVGVVTILIVPTVANVTLKYITNGIENVVNECQQSDCLADITNMGLVNNLKAGSKVLMYYFGSTVVDMASVQVQLNIKPDYELFEKYYSVEPKRRDDIFYYYRLNLNPDFDIYVEGPYATFDEYLEELRNNPHLLDPENSPIPFIIIDNQYYDLIVDTTVGEFCENLIYTKSAALYYSDDEFSGTPIRDVYIDNDHYIVPYFTQKQIYDGNVYFESKGGWGKMVDSGYDFDIIKTQEFDYLETIPYMEIIQNVKGLLQVNLFQIGRKTIFYVMDISDLSEFIETIPTNISHFFVLKDQNRPNKFDSWKNIPADGIVDPAYTIFNGVTEDDIKTATYNNDLHLDNLGNNPHCGYADYDMGTQYYKYLELPFKTPIENYGFSKIEDRYAARQFMFKVEEHIGEKIENLVNNHQPYYILPSKILKIKNNIDNYNYKKYLKEVVLKYIIQVIPSTTILMLENFNPSEEPVPVGDYYYFTGNISVLPDEFSIGDCMLFNEPSVLLENGINDLTLIMVPENIHPTLTYVSDGITSSVDECSEQSCLIRIDGTYVNDLPSGYKVLQYYVPNITTTQAEITLRIN